MLVHDRLYIGGDWVAPTGSDTLEVVSPYTERPVARGPEASTADVDRAVAAARAAFDSGPWPRTPPAERAGLLVRAADLLEARAHELAGLITAEMGSTALFSRFVQVPVPIRQLRWYAELVHDFPFEEERGRGRARSLVVHEPVGVVAAIVPWNTPLLVTMSKLAPALAAGCPVVLKPAPETPLDAHVLAEAFHDAGLPPGVLAVVPAGREVGEQLVRHPGVDKVAITGSPAAGRRIAALCAAKVVTGGGRPAGQPTGWFVEPTVFTGVRNDMRIAREEIFGPVVSVLAYDDPDEAVAIANDSDCGLAGSVWSADVDAGLDVARRVRTGTYGANGAPQASSASFGGFKQSGIGREFGPEGLRLYLEMKSIAVPVGR